MAFGDGRNIMWSYQAHDLFRYNPNVAPPGSEKDTDLVWCPHYGGHRLYGHFTGNKWQWKPFKCIPGEIFLTDNEQHVSQEVGVVIEPRTKDKPNKQWPIDRYQDVADYLVGQGFTVSQLVAPNQRPLLRGVQKISTASFRRALGVLSNASLYIGAEGGLHHGAAAFNIPAVVLFGGFIGPETTGYDSHTNLTGGAKSCGSQWTCSHCVRAMQNISVEEVLSASLEYLIGETQNVASA